MNFPGSIARVYPDLCMHLACRITVADNLRKELNIADQLDVEIYAKGVENL